MEEPTPILAQVGVHLPPEPVVRESEKLARTFVQQSPTDQLVELLGEVLFALAARAPEEGKGELRSEHCRDVEYRPPRLVQRRVTGFLRRVSLSPKAFVVVQLAEEVGIPAGLRVSPGELFRGERRRRVAAAQIVGGLDQGQGSKDHSFRPRRLFELRHPCLPGRRQGRRRTDGRQDPERAVPEFLRKELHRGQRRSVRTMDVLEQEGRGSMAGDLKEATGDLRQDLVPRPRVASFDPREDLQETRFDAHGGRQVGLAHPRGEADQQPPSDHQRVLVRTEKGIGARAIDRRLEERERRRVVERRRPPYQHPDPTGADLSDELRDHGGLPDPCLAHEQRDRTGTGAHVVQSAVKRFHCLPAADERAARPVFARHPRRRRPWVFPLSSSGRRTGIRTFARRLQGSVRSPAPR